MAPTENIEARQDLGYNTAMSDSSEAVAQAFIRAINRQDVEELVELMAPDHRFVDSLGNAVAGREKMRAGWAGYFKMVPDYSIAVEETYCDGPVFLMIGVAEGTYAPDGDLKLDNRWKTPVALRAQVEEGLVTEWRVYADNEPLREKMRKRAQGGIELTSAAAALDTTTGPKESSIELPEVS